MLTRYAHFPLGVLDCWAVSDAAEGELVSVQDWQFNANPDAIELALAEHHLQAEGIAIDWLCLLVKHPDGYVLVDSGSGPNVTPNVGQLLNNLHSLGVEADDIGTVIISHAHLDHIGGTLKADSQLAFPHARVVLGLGERELLDLKPPVPQVLYEAAQRFLPALASKLEYATDGAEILPGIRALAMPGHTPGSTAVEISSAGTRMLFTGDLFYHALQVEHPDWCSQYDLDPWQAMTSRERIYRIAADERLLILPAHAPLPGIGHIIWDGVSYSWQPTP
jgi:glyoxylase-like metal-dependent hydrolase (beta-lactamase superfamily II)